MKLPGALAALLITVGVCVAPYAAEAAGKYDDAAPFVCVPTAVAECVSDGECRPGTAESENLPDFFKIDLKAKTVRAEDKGKQSPIERVDREGDEVTLYGSEAGRAWVLMIREKTGKDVRIGHRRWRELRYLRRLPAAIEALQRSST